jgi:hypothetical protein
MKELVICKACGFIMDKAKVRDVCPACGVPSKVFEPYVEKMSPKRKFLLALDIHPVIVHFPQAFIFSIMMLLVASNFISGVMRSKILTTAEVLIYCLPFVVIGAVVSGMFDGKVRFKRILTPLLLRKIIFGILFILLSSAMFAVNVMCKIDDTSTVHLILLISIISMLCATYLALIGVRLINSKFPG